jgi:ABC-2 type transport system permease protein
MGTAVARSDWNDSLASRIAESFDNIFKYGAGLGLALWLPAGYGVKWLGKHFERPPLETMGGLVTYIGLIIFAIVVLRWLAYAVSPRMAMLIDREVGAYMLSPIAYIVLIAMLVITGMNFWLLVEQLSQVRAEVVGESTPIVRFVAYNLWFWLGMLFVVPAITMRLLAEEKRSGTIEVLMTAPVTEVQVVLSKFIAAVMFYSLVIAPSAFFLLILSQAGKFEIEVRPLLAVYIGILTVGAMFLSIGLFFSSLTRNQIVAFMLTVMVLIPIFSTFVLEDFKDRMGQWWPVAEYVSVLLHLAKLCRGIMDVKFILFHLSVASFMLFVTVKLVEARKWR